ncbi:hypothetical protein ACFLWN_03135 [Chloroflexota bacterium]
MGRLLAFVAVLLLLAPWPVAYASEVTGSYSALVKTAVTLEKPGWQAYGKTISSVTPGTLFEIDCSDVPTDSRATLYLTNADELVHHYRYLMLKIRVYFQGENGEWQNLPLSEKTVIFILA